MFVVCVVCVSLLESIDRALFALDSLDEYVDSYALMTAVCVYVCMCACVGMYGVYVWCVFVFVLTELCLRWTHWKNMSIRMHS